MRRVASAYRWGDIHQPKVRGMGLRITSEATEVLKRSLEMASVDRSSEAGVRLRAATGLGGGTDIQVELASGPTDGEQKIDCDGINVYVDPSVAELYPDAVVALEPQHETIVVRPTTADDDPAADPL